MPEALLFRSTPQRARVWQRRFAEQLPDLEFRIWPEIGDPDEVPHPIVHLANFALPEDRGDFGSGAVDVMDERHVLIVLFEYGPECANTELFARQGLPTKLTPNMFSASALQRTLKGQAGCQLWFTEANRAFCLYTVLGRQSAAARVLPGANATLSATRISPR